MTSLKRHFIKTFSTDVFEILLEDVKLMPDKVLKVSCRYLLHFFSFRENTGGGNIPPALRGLMVAGYMAENTTFFKNQSEAVPLVTS